MPPNANAHYSVTYTSILESYVNLYLYLNAESLHFQPTLPPTLLMRDNVRASQDRQCQREILFSRLYTLSDSISCVYHKWI